MNKFEAHINAGKTVEFKRESGEVDVFTLEPLTYEYLPKIFCLMNKMKDLDKISKDDVGEMMNVFDEDTVKLIQELSLQTMKISYPEEKEELLKKFVASNLFDLFMPIIELNSLGLDTNNVENKKKLETMKKLQDKQSQ